MKKSICIIFIFQLFLGVSGFAQEEMIDSLKKVLVTLTDTARVDCQYELGVQYICKSNKDSALYYTNIVYQGAKKLNYKHGFAIAYLLKASATKGFFNNFSEAEHLVREAIKWFNLTPNKKEIAIAYWLLGRVQTYQSNYDEALNNLASSMEWANKIGEEKAKGMVLETMTDIYRDRGEYVKLLETQQKLIQMDRASGNDGYYSFHELWVLGLMYRLLEEYSIALPFWRKLFVENEGGFVWSWNQMEYAELLTLANQPDSALYYYNLFDSAKADIKDLRFFLISKGEYYLFLNKYDKALPYFLKGLIYHIQLNDRRQINRVFLDIAKTYAALQRNDSAILYARKGLTMAMQTKARPLIRDGYEILYTVFDRLRQRDSAYDYYRNYIILKEAVMNDQTRGKLAAYNYEHKIEMLGKEKQLQQQQIKQTALQKKVLLFSIAGILLLGFIILRNISLKRKNEKQRLKHEMTLQKSESERTKAEMQQQASELEMQALRAQMNPHFIFNSLNSINRFILQNNKAQASEYLTKFSKLVRMILQNSQASLITLESELEALKLYLDLEALRFEQHFNYTITVPDDIDADVLKVPPLIIQPYAENAVWHGLMHKEEKGHLDIEVSQNDDHLLFKITDDGIGRKKATVIANTKETIHKSVGLKITADRIAMLQRLNGNESPVTINDLVNADGSAAGTEVIIKIPLMYD